TTHDVSPPPTDSTWPAHEPPPARRLEPTPGTWRALRESRRGEALETSVLPAPGAPGAGGGGVLARAAAEAAARERDLRARGVSMPRRVLLTISDPARMAQVNLLLRSASYEVRAAFDGRQALDLLRIERADVLLLDCELKELGGLEVLRRLNQRHQGRLPMPVVLFHAPTPAGERERDEALRLGAMGFITLPYDPAALLEAVRETRSKD
ncbi:MAG: response regulator, partial [Pyrinomonadaceae bacterium]